MLAAVESLVGELRAVGLPVSVSEQIDALRALEHTDVGGRAEVRVALRASLVKTAAHEHAFDTVFDLFFRPADGGSGVCLPDLGDDDLRELLVDALHAGDVAVQRAIAAVLVDRYAGDPATAAGGRRGAVLAEPRAAGGVGQRGLGDRRVRPALRRGGAVPHGPAARRVR